MDNTVNERRSANEVARISTRPDFESSAIGSTDICSPDIDGTLVEKHFGNFLWGI